MSKIDAAAKSLTEVDVLDLTDTDIFAAANAAGIPAPGRWHLKRIRTAHAMLTLDALLGR